MPFRARPASIALLEDDPRDAFFVALALETAYIRNPLHVFESVATIRAFLAQLCPEELPTLFVVDLHLRGAENGINFLRWLRQQGGPLGMTPAMVLTGSLELKDREASRALGCRVFLQKPVSERTLTNAVLALGFRVVTSLTSGEMGLRTVERIADPVG